MSNDRQHGKSMDHQNRPGMHLVHLSEDLHKDFARLVARQIQAIHYNARWSESESLFMWDIKISDGILPGWKLAGEPRQFL